jgi:hypothetical protein
MFPKKCLMKSSNKNGENAPQDSTIASDNSVSKTCDSNLCKEL